jgi:hypothetical protein
MMENKEDEKQGKRLWKINKVDRKCDVQVAREIQIPFNDDGFMQKDSSRREILMNTNFHLRNRFC